jgi:nucleoside-diphosphate-sugar epimerase
MNARTLTGCKGFAHVASDLSFSSNPNEIITPVIEFTKNALASAAKEPGLQSFVLTSSSTAATNAKPNQKFHIDTSMWNDEAVKDAWRPPP